MKKQWTLLLTLLMSLTLAGCASKPSDQAIMTQVSDRVSQQGSGFWRAENIKKVNGFEKSDRIYIADVTYEVVFTKSLSDATYLTQQDMPNMMVNALWLMQARLLYGDFKAGERFNKQEKLTFLKTEQGWQLSEADE
jgi:hypothetical protein